MADFRFLALLYFRFSVVTQKRGTEMLRGGAGSAHMRHSLLLQVVPQRGSSVRPLQSSSTLHGLGPAHVSSQSA